MTRKEMRQFAHPSEPSRFLLAMCVTIPLSVVLIAAAAVLFLPILIACLAIWFSMRVFAASLLNNTVRVSSDNFGEIHASIERARQTFGYKNP